MSISSLSVSYMTEEHCNSIAQKLLSRFSQNLDGGWISAQNRPC